MRRRILPRKHPPPIRLQNRQLACENALFSVFFDHIIGSDSHEVDRYLSIFPKSTTKDFLTGVGILPIKSEKYGLIRMYRHPLQRWSWEVPRGMIDPGETSIQAALRELREESGFSLNPTQITELGVTAPAAAMVAGRVKLFVASISSTDEPGNVHYEIGLGEMRFFSRLEIAEMIACGAIEDACTLSAFMLHSIQRDLRPEVIAKV